MNRLMAVIVMLALVAILGVLVNFLYLEWKGIHVDVFQWIAFLAMSYVCFEILKTLKDRID